jgi:predicted  nucleic acid-binding Zn ribbon protein
MYISRVNFGRPAQHKNKAEVEHAAESYLVALLRNGQICGEYVLGWTKGCFNAYVYLPRPNSFKIKFYSKWAKECLAKSSEMFSHDPSWTVLEDDIPKRFQSWKKTPSLYLFTAWPFHSPPVRSMDTGEPLPIYLLPLSDSERDEVYSWAYSYHNHDLIWTESGKLEIPAYKQLAEPDSELSSYGRQVCSNIEKATGIPTFYYLYRYWGRKDEYKSRSCPGCGRKWRVRPIQEHSAPFSDFPFQCDKCRLVSHDACTDEDAKYARIGEYKLRR